MARDQPRLIRAVDPDDAAAGPVAQHGVGARPERVRAVEPGRRRDADQLADVEGPARRRHAGPADADPRAPYDATAAAQRRAERPAVDHEMGPHGVEAAERGARHPAVLTVGPLRHAHLDPRLTAGADARAQ